jgi:hypothetical protein
VIFCCSLSGSRDAVSNSLTFWRPQAAGGVTNRTNICTAFEVSSEFATLVSTLYGTAASDNERTDDFVNGFYLGAYRFPTSIELQQQRNSLNTAAALRKAQMQAQAETMGRALFAAQVTDMTITNTQYVTNLYEGFLRRGPDSGGLSYNYGTTMNNGNVLSTTYAGGGLDRDARTQKEKQRLESSSSALLSVSTPSLTVGLLLQLLLCARLTATRDRFRLRRVINLAGLNNIGLFIGLSVAVHVDSY